MKNKAVIIIVLLALVLTPLGIARADCDDHWEGALIALGATMLFNTIVHGVASPVLPPASICYAPASSVYYGGYCPPAVIEHYNYNYDCPPRVNIWIDHDPPYCYRPYWRRPRVYNYHYNYHYHYHYNRHHHRCREHYHEHGRYRDPHYHHSHYCDPYGYRNCYRPRRYIRY